MGKDTDMERRAEGGGKKRALTGFAAFLALMWLCTVISKSIYASKLPVVTVKRTESKYVEHIVETEGIVVAGSKNPVTALGGLRVQTLAVQVGDKVEEGNVLFTIDIEDLDRLMEEKQEEISRLQLQLNALATNKELAEQKKALEEERARADYDSLARYEDTLVGRMAEEVHQAEEDIEEQAGDEEALKKQLQAAAYAEADAIAQRDNTMKEAQRRIEDIQFPENADATLETGQIELAGLQKELAQFQEIKDAKGEITARQSGLVTDIYISVGSRLPDSAVLLLADDSVPYQFKTTIDSQQKSYVGLKDAISLKLDGRSGQDAATVDYLTESQTAPGNYELYVNLPEGVGMPGLSGVMTCAKAGERYPSCIPSACIQTVNNRNYVYVVKERDGILGMEYYIEEVTVNILDQNDTWAAVEGALDSSSQIVESSDKEIKNGDIVRF
ncbi:MAG: HlyD family secretion protein [Blautia sp.]|nr:HlyD family secretion protein [Lachnoclostridium sp.]MCM1211906.1 HlyD family secretion protein [Blautia sp.]